MNVEIKHNKQLSELSSITGHSIKVLSDNLVGCLWGSGAIDQNFDFFGKSISDLLDSVNYNPIDYLDAATGNTKIQTYKLLPFLYLVNSNEDDRCPDCGFELNVKTDGAFGVVWEEHYCSNESCQFFATTEPDWDLL